MARKTDIRYSEEANNYYRSVRLRFHNFSERLKKNGFYKFIKNTHGSVRTNARTKNFTGTFSNRRE